MGKNAQWYRFCSSSWNTYSRYSRWCRSYVGWQSAYGRLIKIKHDFGIETRYAHLSKFRVKKGQRVSRGQHIGDMGNTGRSTGTHLHYEIRIGGKAINPMKYIKAAKNVF